MLLKFKAEAKSLRPKGHETKAEAKIVASRSVWSRVFNISAFKSARESVYFIQIKKYGYRILRTCLEPKLPVLAL